MADIVAFIPAHNEELRLSAAIRSLESQSVSVSRVVVISDNSTDATAGIARGWGGTVELFETSGNTDKKSGALNQALRALMPDIDDETWVLVMDADSRLVDNFIGDALAAAAKGKRIGAVGGVFQAESSPTLLTRFQENEYIRYAREIARGKADAKVLTGTATMLKAGILRKVYAARLRKALPGEGFYNQKALCEDFELTVALKTLGYGCISPKGCLVYTEVMETLPKLWRQRTRWQRGALEVLTAYGVTRKTLPYFAKQAQMAIGILAMVVFYALTVYAVVSGTFDFQQGWFVLGSVFTVERVVSVWRGGTKNIRLAMMLVPEALYDMFISVVYVWVCGLVLFRTQVAWGTATVDNR